MSTFRKIYVHHCKCHHTVVNSDFCVCGVLLAQQEWFQVYIKCLGIGAGVVHLNRAAVQVMQTEVEAL